MSTPAPDSLPTPEALNLDQILTHFDTDDKARAYLESIRWPLGVVCPHCQNRNEAPIWKLEENAKRKVRPGLYSCGKCGKQFTVTVGTIFEDTHIPLRKWLIGWYLLCSSKKGISSLQIKRALGLGSYRTALFMTHRMRHALKDPIFSDKLSGTVEIDETYVGGKLRGVGSGFKGNKTPVVSLVERKGRVRSVVMEQVTSKNLKETIAEHVQKSSTIYTDERSCYPSATREFAAHERVNHAQGEWKRGDVHTNSVESFFALLKRGIIGTFHQVSKQHLPLYLAEFDHRYNHRKVSDGERTMAGIAKCEGKRLTYYQLKSRRLALTAKEVAPDSALEIPPPKPEDPNSPDYHPDLV
jgi:transposase-like protein